MRPPDIAKPVALASTGPSRPWQASQTRPTGLSGVPPPGPAIPVTETPKSARDRAIAPAAMARATSSDTAPNWPISAASTPSISVFAALL